MKKCSTRFFALSVTLWSSVWSAFTAPAALGAALLGGALALAAPASAQAPAGGTAPLELAQDAPDKYVVVKGDTLWDISGRFLRKPWRWPEIWQLNKDEIRNPHLIYPGDLVYLDLSGGQPRLRLGKAVGGGAGGERRDVLQPSVRSQPLDRSPIPTVSAAAIESFINRPLIVDETGLRTHPYIVGTQEGRVYLGRGDVAYVRGIADASTADWHIYRPARPLLDPDTRKPIAYEALYVGSARVERLGDPSTLRITGTSEEVGEGDRLMPAERGRMVNYAPRAPGQPIQGRLVSVYRGVAQAGRNSVVAMNIGSEHGVEVGHVLSINQLGATVRDREKEKREFVKLPDESIGYLLVFRVFDKIAYGLIMDSSRAVSVGDLVATP